MPWHIEKDEPRCPTSESWGVVKDDDNELEGCHATKAEAEEQLAALYASEEDSNSMDKEQIMQRYPALKRAFAEEREVRAIKGQPVEARTEGEDELRIAGHAAVFGEWANIGGWFLERIDSSAFDKTIGEADVRMLLNHDPNHILARTKNGTLQLGTDDVGLTYDGEINRDDPSAVATHAKIARGDIDQSSFAFRVVEEEWREADDEFDLPQRTIKEAQLFDVSPVTYPAYEGTDVGVRGAALGLLSSMLGLPEKKREMLLRAMEDEIELPEDLARAVDIISPVFEALLRNEEISIPEEDVIESTLEGEEEAEPAAAEEADSESEEDSEPEVGPADEAEPGEPAAEEAPDEEEVEGETDDERQNRYARWFAQFIEIEGRPPTIDEIERQFPSNAIGEPS